MRILLLGEAFYPEVVGGIERRNADLAAALARRGHDVTLAAFGEGNAAPGVRVVSLGPSRPIYGRAGIRVLGPAWSMGRAAARIPLGSYDVVETSSLPFAHLFPLAARCALAGKPLVVGWYEFWGSYWNEYAGPRRGPVFRAVERAAARLGHPVASSALTAARFASRTGRTPPVVPCGTDVAEIAAATAGIEPEPNRVVYAGRLLAHKRVDLLLEAVARLPEVRLVVYGTGPERGRLADRARRPDLGSRVELRTPARDRAEVWREIRRSALAVLPSIREGFGIFPLEAMAAGVPVVCVRSEMNAVPELVRDGIEGICAEPTVEALAGAIGGLLASARRAEMGERARVRAAGYGADAAAAALEGIFSNLLERGGGKRPESRDRRDSAA